MRGYLEEDLAEDRVRLAATITPKRMRALLRDLGYVVELAVAPEGSQFS